MPLIENKIFSHRSVGRETKREDLPRKVGLKKKDQLVINKDQSQEAENSIGNEGTDVEHIELVEPEKWIERLTVCATHTLSLPSEYIDDDAQREEAFVNHARKSVDDALLRLERLGIPWQRPVNYYAEMMKSDVHMHRVQEELERSEEVIRRRAQRRQESYQRKFSKELKSEHAKKEAERKRKLAIAVETAKRRSARRMKEEGATSRLFGAIIPSRGSRGKGYDYDGEDDDMDADRGESRYPVRKNRRQTGKQYPNASGGNKERNRTLGRRSGVSKKRPGKVARRRRQN